MSVYSSKEKKRKERLVIPLKEDQSKFLKFFIKSLPLKFAFKAPKGFNRSKLPHANQPNSHPQEERSLHLSTS